MRQLIVDNFQERMQLRRSLIELEDQNVQNTIEVSKRQLLVVHWLDLNKRPGEGPGDSVSEEELLEQAPPNIRDAWVEVEQLKKAVLKNGTIKQNIIRRLRRKERVADQIK
jgi:kinesin family protein 18/19